MAEVRRRSTGSGRTGSGRRDLRTPRRLSSSGLSLSILGPVGPSSFKVLHPGFDVRLILQAAQGLEEGMASLDAFR